MRLRWLRWTLVAAGLVLAGAIALWPRSGPAPAADATGLGSATPDIGQLRAAAALRPCPTPEPGTTATGPLAGVTLPCLDSGDSVDLGAALAGGPALLNLWSPLCGPCIEEMPALAAYASQPGSVPVIGVQVGGSLAGGLNLLAELDVHYPSVRDPDGQLRAALGSPPVLPLTYVVRPDGRVLQVNPPQVFGDPAEVRAAVQHYLRAGAGG